MGLRRPFVFISIAILIAGLVSAGGRQLTEGGTDAFNLGVDFQGGTVITAKFRQRPSDGDIRNALQGAGITEAVIQNSTDKADEVLIKVPILGSVTEGQQQAAAVPANATAAPDQGNANVGAQATPQAQGATQVDQGRSVVKSALDTFGREAEPTLSLD